jgi:hypothetical protein
MSEAKLELPCRFCNGLFLRDFNEGFTDPVTGRYHYIVSSSFILSEEQHFHKDGRRRLGRKHQKKKIVREQTESEESNHDVV